jgi:hypothetical protein
MWYGIAKPGLETGTGFSMFKVKAIETFKVVASSHDSGTVLVVDGFDGLEASPRFHFRC